MIPKPLPELNHLHIRIAKAGGLVVPENELLFREREWRESVQWLREELCSCGIGSGQGDCYTCKAINKAFVGGKE